MKTKFRSALALAGAILAGLSLCAANAGPPASSSTSAPAPVLAAENASTYEVPLYKSVVVPLRRPARHVSVGNPGVADIISLRSEQLYVVGKTLGSTNVIAWDESGTPFASFNVEVTHDLEGLKSKLHDLLPDENIKVYSAQQQLILSGQVSSPARLDAAKQLASGFLPVCISAQSDAPDQAAEAAHGSARITDQTACRKASVVNLLQVGGANQVMLKVTVAEMSRTVVKNLSTNLNLLNFGSHWQGGAVAGGASFPPGLGSNGLATPIFGSLSGQTALVGPPVASILPNTPTISNTGAFLSYLGGNTLIDAVIDISKRNGLARILSEPTLTTLTGQEAQFLSGGEFPVPVPQGGTFNNTTIEFKEFGVALKFLPVVLDSGRINLAINVAVSNLSSENQVVLNAGGTSSTTTANAFVIPSLTKRSAASTVELGDGQTIGIAGLIDDQMQSYVQKFPGLGEVPVLGALFRSQQYQSGQTELVIFVTPHLAAPIAPQQVKLPTEKYVPPGDLDFYLFGRQEGKEQPKSGAAGQMAAPKGSFGHDVSSAQ